MIMGIEYRCSYLSFYSETSFDILGGIYRPCVVLIDGECQRVTFGEVDNRIGRKIGYGSFGEIEGFDMYSSQIDRIGQFHRYHAFIVVDSGCTDLSVGGDP